jgi:hypothetical protein
MKFHTGTTHKLPVLKSTCEAPEGTVYARIPAISALKVAAHNLIEPTVAEHQGFELETAGPEQINSLLILVGEPAQKSGGY